MAQRIKSDEQAFVKLKIDTIQINPGRRPPDECLVLALAESMLSIGQLHPITVRRCPGLPSRYELLAGRQRLMARKHVGFTDVIARVISASDEEAQVVEIDENFHRWELSLDEVETALEQRKEAIKNPPTARKAYLRDNSVGKDLQSAWDVASYQERSGFLFRNALMRMPK